jgi:hypothetical protein
MNELRWGDAHGGADGDAGGVLSEAASGGWNVVSGAHDDPRRSVWTDPDAVRSGGDDANVPIAHGYPARPVSQQSDRQQRIRRAQQLRQEGWRQREIAAALGVSRSTISHWLTHLPPTGTA